MPKDTSNDLMPTTREIAAACKCSQATVSYALNGHPKIPPATREQILTTAQRLGWKPNAFASAYMAHLRTQRAPAYQATLAFLITHPRSKYSAGQLMHIQRHFVGAKQRARKIGYEVEAFWTHEMGLSGRRLNQILRSRNIPGLLIPGIETPDKTLDQIEWSWFAAVAFGYSLSKPNLHRVAVNTAHGYSMMLSKAAQLGYRRIGVMVSDAYDSLVNHGVLYPTFYAQKRPDPAMHNAKILICRFKKPCATEINGIQKWLLRERPDVVLGESIVYDAIKGLGWKIPQDVALISVDRAPEYPDIGGFNQHHELHGSVAVDMLVGLILQNERGIPSIPREVLVKGEWADGISVPPKETIATLGLRSATAEPSFNRRSLKSGQIHQF